MQNLKYVVILLVIFVSGCKKKEDDTNPPATTYGKIVGNVVLTDEFGNLLASNAGVNVMLVEIGTIRTGTSDASGHFEITEIGTGTYTLYYSKSGMGTYERFGIPVDASISGTTTLSPTDTLGEISTTSVTNLSVTTDNVNHLLDIQCDLSPAPSTTQRRAIRLFFGQDTLVSSVNYQYSPSTVWSSTTTPGIIDNYPASNLTNNGFAVGDTAYLIVYGESIKTNSYHDQINMTMVFPNLNLTSPSTKVMLIVP